LNLNAAGFSSDPIEIKKQTAPRMGI